MAHPDTYRPRASDIPTAAGVYRFLDAQERVIYVGKAKSLRKRLSSYFRDVEKLHPRTRQMVFTAVDVKWVVVQSELEALTLEYAWIKEFAPHYNIMYRDDKSYPYLTVTTAEKYPRILVTRNAHKRGNRYYGPYTNVKAVRESVDLLQQVFAVRSCSNGVFNEAKRTQRPCLNGYIEKCSAPCVGNVSELEHRNTINNLITFLDSSGEKLIAEKKQEMEIAVAALNFELAAKLRDQIKALEVIVAKNSVVLDKTVNADIFGIDFDELEASIQVFYVRAGRIRGQRGWVSQRTGQSVSELLGQLILQVYGEFSLNNSGQKLREKAKSVDDIPHMATTMIPNEIWLPELPENTADLQVWLGQLKGQNVYIKQPQRGVKADLLKTVHLNAQQALQQHKLQRQGDIAKRSQALEELRKSLQLANAPLRIECYDISHTQGTHQVGSMVVFHDGLPKKSDYRHFIVRGEAGQGARDDTAAMNEVLTRRLNHLKQGQIQGESFTSPPDLLVVDGGLPQVNAAYKAVNALNLDIPIIGIAKRLEEVWLPYTDFPIILPRTSPSLYLLQYLRDESHRFAITHHRKRRANAMLNSQLEQISGLGEQKQKALLRRFGSAKKISDASIEQLQTVPGIGAVLAGQIYNFFHEPKE